MLWGTITGSSPSRNERWLDYLSLWETCMRRKNLGRLCSIPGCERPARARSWCSDHYSRYRNYGDPTAGRTPEGEPLRWLRKSMPFFSESCVRWPYARKEEGYGAVLYEGVIMGAHRAACFIAHGPPPAPDMVAAHSCGKGHEGCVNHKHLRWATHQENVADRALHERLGIARPRKGLKLTEQNVEEILAFRGKEKIATLAKRFGVHQSMISKIHNGHRRAQETSCI